MSRRVWPPVPAREGASRHCSRWRQRSCESLSDQLAGNDRTRGPAHAAGHADGDRTLRCRRIDHPPALHHLDLTGGHQPPGSSPWDACAAAMSTRDTADDDPVSWARMASSRCWSCALSPRRRHPSPQQSTCSQLRSHFFRQAMRRPQDRQILSSNLMSAECFSAALAEPDHGGHCQRASLSSSRETSQSRVAAAGSRA